jgi:hypothetical protein
LDGAHGGRDKRILDLADLSEAQLMGRRIVVLERNRAGTDDASLTSRTLRPLT